MKSRAIGSPLFGCDRLFGANPAEDIAQNQLPAQTQQMAHIQQNHKCQGGNNQQNQNRDSQNFRTHHAQAGDQQSQGGQNQAIQRDGQEVQPQPYHCLNGKTDQTKGGQAVPKTIGQSLGLGENEDSPFCEAPNQSRGNQGDDHAGEKCDEVLSNATGDGGQCHNRQHQTYDEGQGHKTQTDEGGFVAGGFRKVGQTGEQGSAGVSRHVVYSFVIGLCP